MKNYPGGKELNQPGYKILVLIIISEFCTLANSEDPDEMPLLGSTHFAKTKIIIKS